MITDLITEAFNLQDTYRYLPESLYAPVKPVPVAAPSLVVLNEELAASLGIDISRHGEDEWAQLLSGNLIPAGAVPIALAYAGHQFGNFTMLGDGRAVLMGEHLAPDGRRFDIQLKGSGQTPFSRRGDGRATGSAMLREYLVSEAMHHLGIPTSRSLAVVATGEKVWRDGPQEGAVLTRVASSHIRVGSFEYVANFLDKETLSAYTEYVIGRHYPGTAGAERPALALLEAVMEKQIDLIVHWMRVGFIHGVMNTDNMSIPGETIDYGPCAFMNVYRPSTVFSSIDTQGRYAFSNQPAIAQWNLAVLAGTLLPLIAEDEASAVRDAQDLLNDFPNRYTDRWYRMMAAKIGIDVPQPEDRRLVDELLQLMQTTGADYTNTFLALEAEGTLQLPGIKAGALDGWRRQWTDRVQAQPAGLAGALERMRQTNPAFIPRNHLVESALKDAVNGNLTSFRELLGVMSSPYDRNDQRPDYQDFPETHDKEYRTFCGT